MFGFLSGLRKGASTRHPAQRLKEFATCESVFATATSPLHLRVINTDPRTESGKLHTGGGLGLRNIPAACGHEVAWDKRDVSREEVLAGLPNQHESFRYCEGCLDFTGIKYDI